jgi:hypothetical protein
MAQNKAETCTNLNLIIKVWVVKDELCIISHFVQIHNGMYKPTLKWKLLKNGTHS